LDENNFYKLNLKGPVKYFTFFFFNSNSRFPT